MSEQPTPKERCVREVVNDIHEGIDVTARDAIRAASYFAVEYQILHGNLQGLKLEKALMKIERNQARQEAETLRKQELGISKDDLKDEPNHAFSWEREEN